MIDSRPLAGAHNRRSPVPSKALSPGYPQSGKAGSRERQRVSMRFDRFHWIRTRDGSPTLYDNDEGAAFRSQKGAFTESLCVFVRPALEHLLRSTTSRRVEVVEFGLGPGTNWALWQLSVHVLREKASAFPVLEHGYTAIEKEPLSFELGFAAWTENPKLLASFVGAEWEAEISEQEVLDVLQGACERLRVVASLEALAGEAATRADIWFHDPFGFDVNPTAYQRAELERIRALMSPWGRGFSYACNAPFQKTLRASGFDVAAPRTGNAGLKRERLEFWPGSAGA